MAEPGEAEIGTRENVRFLLDRLVDFAMAEAGMERARLFERRPGARLRARKAEVPVLLAIVWVARAAIVRRDSNGNDRPASYPAIGRAIGRSDHSSVIYYFREAEARRAADEDFAAWCDRLLREFRRADVDEVVAGMRRRHDAMLAERAEQRARAEQVRGAVDRMMERAQAGKRARNSFAVAEEDKDAGHVGLDLLRGGSIALIAALRREHPERCGG